MSPSRLSRVGIVVAAIAAGSTTSADLQTSLNAARSYSDAISPDNGSDRTVDFEKCKIDAVQSAYDAQVNMMASLPDLYFDYLPTPLTVEDYDHTILTKGSSQRSLKIDGKAHELLQTHFHTPNEYRIKGKSFALEMHLVYVASNQIVGVVSVLIEEGAVNPAFEKIRAGIPSEHSKTHGNGVSPNWLNLLPNSIRHIHFIGSLATPHCSDGVTWYRMNESITLSSQQIEQIRKHYQENTRPL